MKKKILGLIGIILSITVLLYFETYTYKFISIIGINLNNYSDFINTILNILIKLIMCIIIYFIYKTEFRKKHSSNNIFKSLIFFIVYLIALIIGMYLFKYIINFIGDIFNVSILSDEFYNIFDKTLDFNLIIKIINDYIIIPFLYCSTILLSIDKLCRRNDTFYMFSGILSSIVYSVNLSGTVMFVIINSINSFILFLILSIIYKKRDSIWFTIALYSFYLITNILILNVLGW